MRTHPISTIHIEPPHGRMRIENYIPVIGLISELHGEVWIRPFKQLDAFQQARLIDAGERVWLLGRDVLPGDCWKLEQDGSRTTALHSRGPRTWAEREQATALAVWA